MAEVKRREFQNFIENIHKKILKSGVEESVVFKFWGPASATVEFFHMMISFLLMPVLIAFGASFFPELRSLNDFLLFFLIIVVVLPLIALGFYLGYLFVKKFSPNGKYNPREFPEFIFDMANAEITDHCNRALKKKRLSAKSV